MSLKQIIIKKIFGYDVFSKIDSLKVLEEQIDAYRDANAILIEEYKSSRQKIKVINDSLNKLKDSVQTQKTELAEKELRLKETVSELKKANTKNDEYKSTIASLEKRITVNIERLGGLQKQLNAKDKSEADLLSNIENLKTEIETHEQKKDSQNALIDKLRKQLNTKETEQKIERETAEKLHADIESLKTEIETHEQYEEAQNAVIAKLQEQLNVKDKNEANLLSNIESLKDEIATREQKTDSQNTLINKLQEQLSIKETEQKEERETAEKLLADITSLKNEIENKDAEISNSSSIIAELREQVKTKASSNLEIKTLERQNQKLEEEINDLHRKIDVLNNDLSHKDNEINEVGNLLLHDREYSRQLAEKLTEKETIVQQKDKLIEDLKNAIEILERKDALSSIPSRKEPQISELQNEEEAQPTLEQQEDSLATEQEEEDVQPIAEQQEDSLATEQEEEEPQPIVEQQEDSPATEQPEEEAQPIAEQQEDSPATEQPEEETQPIVEQQEDSPATEQPGEETQSIVEQQEESVQTHQIVQSSPLQEKNTSKEKDAVDLSDGTMLDFPPVENDSDHSINRSIEYVYDEKNKKTINANEFFSRSAEEIARMSRQLQEDIVAGHPNFFCGMCNNPVRIAHRTYNGVEGLFFAHAQRGVSCPWSKPATASRREYYKSEEIDDEDIVTSEDNRISLQKPKNRILKEQIFKLLSSDQSKECGISNVKIDSMVTSDFPYMVWRRPDISFSYKGTNMVILMQKKTIGLHQIVDKDIFFRLTNYQTLWVFGSDSDTSYDYLRKSNYKNTMYDNHRNVFVFDKEAQQESEKRGELVLKCNWLDENNAWRYTVDKDNKNGCLIDISSLTFDKEYCKPYYFEANKPYFDLHPKALEWYLKTRKTREELLKQLERNWFEDANYKDAIRRMREYGAKATPYTHHGFWGFRFHETTLIQPIFTSEPEDLGNGFYMVKFGESVGLVDYYAQKVFDWELHRKYDKLRVDTENNRIIYCTDGLWGICDMTGKDIINPRFTEIKTWSFFAYRVKRGMKWGLCSINDEMLTDCKYDNIDNLVRGQAQAQKADADKKWIVRKGFLDEKGQEKDVVNGKMPNGNVKFDRFGLKGVKDDSGNIIINPEYEDIKPWTATQYRVFLNDQWGVLNTPDCTYLLQPQYDDIGELVEGKAKVEEAGRTTYVDNDGNLVSEESIDLMEGYKKEKIGGKWGIVKDGEVIINHKYDEIGSFRQRLIGVINGRIIKLDAYYEYPILISGTCIKKHKNVFAVDVAGVKFYLPLGYLRQFDSNLNVKEGDTLHNLVFANIVLTTKTYTLRPMSQKKMNTKMKAGDRKNTFEDGVVLQGTVQSLYCRSGKFKNALVKLQDDTIIRVHKTCFIYSKVSIEKLAPNMTIEIKKVGFDDEYDRIKWKVLKLE